MNDPTIHTIQPSAPSLRSLPKALTIQPVLTLKSLVNGRNTSWAPPLKYFGLMLLLYVAVRVIAGYDPLENTEAISGEPIYEKPSLRTIKKAGFFATRYYWLFIGIYALVVGMACKVIFTRCDIGQRQWWKVCFFLAGQFLLFNTLVIPLTYLNPYFYFLPFILEVVYLTPVLAGYGSRHPVRGIVYAFLAVLLGHGLYSVIVFCGAIGGFSLLT